MITREKLNEIRYDTLENIEEIVKSIGGELYLSDLNDGCSPIVQECPSDEDGTFTLDSIKLEGDDLLFNASSNWSECTFYDHELGIEVLVGILEFLEDNKETINELKENES